MPIDYCSAGEAYEMMTGRKSAGYGRLNDDYSEPKAFVEATLSYIVKPEAQRNLVWIVGGNKNSVEKTVREKIFPLIGDIKSGKCAVSRGISQSIEDILNIKVPPTDIQDDRLYIMLKSESGQKKLSA